jgi:hypothetical protein
MEQIRQGDVLVHKVDDNFAMNFHKAVEKGEVEVVNATEDGRLILAEGEATGHHHAIRADAAKMFMYNGMMILQILALTKLFHEEHNAIDLDPGLYQVVRQREFNPLTDEQRVLD